MIPYQSHYTPSDHHLMSLAANECSACMTFIIPKITDVMAHNFDTIQAPSQIVNGQLYETDVGLELLT